MRPGVARLLVTAAMAMIGAGPALAEPRGLALAPGSGIVKRTGGRSPRRDAARQAAAQAKRERKNAKRLRNHLWACSSNPCHPHAVFSWRYARGK